VADLLQFLVKTPITPKAKFYSGGVLTDLDGPAGGTCTVTLTKPDGTPGPASGTVTHVATGIYSFVLDGPADPIVYDIAWSGQIGSRSVTQTTQAEALGELLFTIPALRAFKVGDDTPFASDTTWSDEQLMDARAATLDEFTQILGFSPVPRFARSVVDGDGLWSVLLPHLKCHRLLSVTVNGATQSVGSYTLRRSGVLEATSGYVASGTFTAGRQNVVAEYVHGEQRVMGDGGNVAMLRAAMRLQPGISSTASSVTTPDGVSYSFDAAGQVTQAGTVRHFGVPALDSWLNRWAQAGLAVA
jgi:hypothetical protein